MADAATIIRDPAVAGRFYPAEPDALRAMVESSFGDPLGPGARPALVADGPRRLFGMIVPHAGYVYSGQGVAWGMAAAAVDGRPAAVCLLGVNHRGVGAPIAVSPADVWATPLGDMPVAVALARRLTALNGAVHYDARPHADEHALEVLLPYLQVVYGTVPILPVSVGAASLDAVTRLGEALAVLAAETDLLLVASSDFSHGIPRDRARRLDGQALQAIVAVDPKGLVEVVQQYGITMCGVLPVFALLVAARARGVRAGCTLHYHTSGDVSGDVDAVVGYGTAVFYQE